MNDDPALYRNTYRIRSTRLRGWDYTWVGGYFITICTKDRIRWFGDVRDGRTCLSDIGKIVDEEWNRTSAIRPYVTLDRYVIMPDHMHGIIALHERTTDDESPIVETPRWGVSVPGKTQSNHRPEWKPGSLGAIINQFKTACTKRIRGGGYHDFAWQPRFHDHLIRNEREMARIREYIDCNPIKWDG